MKIAFKVVVTVFFLVMAVAPVTSAAPRFEVGQPFPDLVLPSIEDGTPMSIADFRGQKLVLHVFASW